MNIFGDTGSLMVDWLTVYIPLSHHEMIIGKTYEITDWENSKTITRHTGRNYTGSADVKILVSTYVPCFARVENLMQQEDSQAGRFIMPHGSYENDTMYQYGYVKLSGNLNNFLAGHNLYGSVNIRQLVLATVEKICAENPDHFNFRLPERQAIKRGEFGLSMIDINGAWMMESQEQCLTFVKALEFQAEARGRGNFRKDGDTLYFGKNSRHNAGKIYAKGPDFKRKKKDLYLHAPEHLLTAVAEKMVRLEFRILPQGLKNMGMCLAKQWSEKRIHQHFNEKKELIRMSSELTSFEKLDCLTKAEFKYYSMWKNGIDLRPEAGIISRATYYRQKEALYQKLGILIDIPEASHKTKLEKRPESNVLYLGTPFHITEELAQYAFAA